ncbi:DUF3492 domain-containing protein [Streptomyces sp. VRA16 Mangrove soil]|uniref:DUF3492 domain-containing protein n=1 Tax=Streptomyces sp. VRA16 Mangrove soil TaxID=2817434 RepID=UPI001A9FBA95|nr:DUF3492 domain-containing protein [Streptomyces sp. VRA16 Mangrove soil]MBO1337067.1 DUF3492 domain-containing protein [Streptomyces sp. VRA16 Mangrove soil]
MRIGLLTEGGYPYVSGEARLWCDRLVRGLEQHEFDIYALSRSQEQEDAGWLELPPQVCLVRTASLWSARAGSGEDGVRGGDLGRRARRRFAALYAELVGSVVCGGADGGDLGAGAGAGAATGVGGGGRSEADRFANALYGLAELARDEGGLGSALRSEAAVRILERACRAPGALRAARAARVPDLLAFAAEVESTLRPLSLDWYDDASGPSGLSGGGGLGAVDLCHATSGGAAALPGLVAKRFHGVPLLVTEYGVQLRARYIAAGDAELSAPVRALLAAFHGRLAAEIYRQAAVITPGNAHARRWQERCGADRAKLRTVHPGMEASRFAEVGEREEPGDPDTLVWVGRIDPSKDLISLLHAFAEVRKGEPKARLRIVGALPAGAEGDGDQEAEAYLGHCKALAAQLFPDEAEGLHAVGDNPVSFEELGAPEAPGLAEVYGSGGVVVLSSVVEGFPISLVEAMFCGRATVSTDVGAVVEVIGGTGLVVPPRNPRALAEACVALLRDSERRERLGAAARARALELFTVEQNIAAFHGIYLEIVSHCPVRREAVDDAGEPLPFAHPPEAHVPGRWTASAAGGTGGAWLAGRSTGTGAPSWASGAESGGAREELAGVTRGCGESDA